MVQMGGIVGREKRRERGWMGWGVGEGKMGERERGKGGCVKLRGLGGRGDWMIWVVRWRMKERNEV